MEFDQFIIWVFYSLLSGCAIYAVTILSKMQRSIEDLNIKMATVIAKYDSHDKLLSDLNERVKFIEHK